VTRAGYLPRVEAFADAALANPNQRAFPQTQGWDFTWDAGVRLTWTVNDTLATAPAMTEAKARTAVAIEQKNTLRSGLEIEVATAYSDMKKAASSIEAATRGLAAAEESLRVRSELFKSGKATSVDLIDAETEVTRGRLRKLDAHIGLLVAKTRLDHATGRDVKELKEK
jgi:outer membrane protein TolC